MLGLGLGLGLGKGSGGAAFDPLTLSPGAWYDPSDMTTLFQDDAGTTPVTASGQPVGKMLDKSGNGLHATQATAANRPIYTESGGLKFLAFDGVNDVLSFAPALALLNDFTFAAAYISRHAPAADKAIAGLSATSHWVAYDNDPGLGSGGFKVYDGANAYYENTNAVNSARVVLQRQAAAAQTARINGAASAFSYTATWGPSGSPSNCGIGGAATFAQYAQFDFHGALLRGGGYTAGEQAALETYLGSKVGLVL